jgi:hypothetical protein
VPALRVVSYDFEDLDATAHTLKIPVQAGTYVLEVTHLTTTAFAGGTPALKIGDGDDDDGYLTAAVALLNTAGDVVSSKRFFSEDAGGVATMAAFQDGKYYTAAGYILVTHAADLSAGVGKVMILELTAEDLAGNWRQPAV